MGAVKHVIPTYIYILYHIHLIKYCIHCYALTINRYDSSLLCIALYYYYNYKSSLYMFILWLVVYLPLWKIWKSIGMMTFPNKYFPNVPNHQPVSWSFIVDLPIKKLWFFQPVNGVHSVLLLIIRLYQQSPLRSAKRACCASLPGHRRTPGACGSGTPWEPLGAILWVLFINQGL